MTSARGARAQCAMRHHRVARKEAALSPQNRMIQIRKHGAKIIAAGIGVLLLVAVKWFTIGYFVGRNNNE